MLDKRIPILVFDIGGVLLDWDPRYLYADLLGGSLSAADAFLDEIGFFEWNARQDAGYPFAAAVKEHIRRFPHRAELIRAYDTRWMDMLRGAIQPTVDLMLRLRYRGYSAWALSNWSAEKFYQVRPMYPFLEQMDGIIISGELGHVKPGERIFQILLERVGQAAQDCLFIDDSPANTAAARTLGFKTILYRSTLQLEEELNQAGIHADQ